MSLSKEDLGLIHKHTFARATSRQEHMLGDQGHGFRFRFAFCKPILDLNLSLL